MPTIEKKVTKVARSFHILASGFRKCEVKQYQGRDHLVVPVVALVEGVVWASNADAPELVLASELAKAPGGWDGRPVMMNHPTNGGKAISANHPAVLEEHSFGQVFDTELDGKKLTMNAWLDLEKAKTVEGAGDLITAIENDEMVEVSVGVYVVMEESVGEFDGETYRAIWREIVPDHLALLPEGTIGACSNEMGCGVPRSATIHISTSRGLVALNAKERGTMKGFKAAKAAWDAYVSTILVAASLSDRDLRDRLNRALATEDPYCLGVEAVYQDEGKVVYAAWGDHGLVFYRRGYTQDEEDKITLNDDREDVVRQDLFVTASEKPHSCSCGGASNKKELASMEKKARVKALIARKDNAYVEADTAYLEGLSEERLKALEDFKPEVETATTEETDDTKKKPVVDPDPPTKDKGADEEGKPGPAPKAKTAEEYVADAPPEVQAALQEGMKAAAAKKGSLIKALRDSKRCDYTDAELKAMSIADLERMAKLAAAEVPEIDYSAQGGPRERALKAEDQKVPAAPSLFDNVRTMAGRSKETKSA